MRIVTASIRGRGSAVRADLARIIRNVRDASASACAACGKRPSAASVRRMGLATNPSCSGLPAIID
jgi:hypothetical protein